MFPNNCLLICVIVVLTLTGNSDELEISSLRASPNFRVVCYYASWASVRPGIGQFSPQNINPHLCTHVIYAFGGLTKEVTLRPFDESVDIEQGGYAKFTGLKEYNKDLKTLLAIGRWNQSTVKFSAMAANVTKRRDFVKNSIAFLRQYNFDGLSIHWQYPYRKDRRSYSSLIQELREGFESESKETNQSRLLLTITLPITNQHLAGYHVHQLTKYVDWMDVLTYNYHTESEPTVKHHAQLYGVNLNSDYGFNANDSITSYLNYGANPNKLVLGIPTFGRTYNLSDPTTTDIGSPASGPGLEGDQTYTSGYLAYYEICKKIKFDGWMVNRPYPNEMGPYAYKGNQWVSYDDETIVRKKSQYVAENKLGGIMFWLMEFDDFRGICTGKSFPLIEAAKETLLAASGYIVEKVRCKSRSTIFNRIPITVKEDEKDFGTATSSIVQYTTPEPPPTPTYNVELLNKFLNTAPEIDFRFLPNLSPPEMNEAEDCDLEENNEENPDSASDLNNFRVICYYASWAARRSGIGRFTPENIDPYLCTHIIYAFGGLSNKTTLQPSDEEIDIQNGGYAKFTGLKSQNKDLKTMLGLGGWNEGHVQFADMAANSTKRREFIANSIEFLRKHNFDGMELDWQFPYENDRNSYSVLIKDLSEAYQREATVTGRPRLLLSITLSSITDHSYYGYDVPELIKYVDWMDSIAYDYHREFEPVVYHHTQLYGVDETVDAELNANYTINFYLNSGAQREKLVLGIPTYGRAYYVSDTSMTDFGSEAAGPGLPGEQTNESGFLAFYEICKKIKDEDWIVRHPYPDAMGPYAYKGNQWISYDDENIIRKKAEFAIENKLGGIMFWVLEYDDFLGSCTGKKFPLIEAAKGAIMDASRMPTTTSAAPLPTTTSAPPLPITTSAPPLPTTTSAPPLPIPIAKSSPTPSIIRNYIQNDNPNDIKEVKENARNAKKVGSSRAIEQQRLTTSNLKPATLPSSRQPHRLPTVLNIPVNDNGQSKSRTLTIVFNINL